MSVKQNIPVEAKNDAYCYCIIIDVTVNFIAWLMILETTVGNTTIVFIFSVSG